MNPASLRVGFIRVDVSVLRTESSRLHRECLGVACVSIVIVLILAALFCDPAYAQSGNGAALAGAGAGAALGPSLLGGTGGNSSSSGNAAPEIQIMAFASLTKVANEITKEVSSVYPCQAALDEKDKNFEKFVEEYVRSNPKEAQAARALERYSQSQPECPILVEDTVSANQIALYRAFENYHGQFYTLYDRLAKFFALQIAVPKELDFGEATPSLSSSLTIRMLNLSHLRLSIPIAGISASDPNINYGASTCTMNAGNTALDLKANEVCDVTFVLAAPKDIRQEQVIAAKISVPNDDTGTSQSFEVKGSIKPDEPRVLPHTPGAVQPQYFVNPQGLGSPFASTVVPGVASSGTSGGGSAPTAPLGWTYLGDIMSALNSAKTGMAYTASGFQPPAVSFQTLIEKALYDAHYRPFTSTSALNLSVVEQGSLTQELGEMLRWFADATAWSVQCKPNPNADSKPDATGKSTPPPAVANPNCTSEELLAELAASQQMLSGYTALISMANDGSGSPAIVSILRGKVLADKMKSGIPALQVSVVAAGGSTKTNNIALINLGYVFAPSYNAGAIATYELRDKDNVLLTAGYRQVLFNYTKYDLNYEHYDACNDEGSDKYDSPACSKSREKRDSKSGQ